MDKRKIELADVVNTSTRNPGINPQEIVTAWFNEQKPEWNILGVDNLSTPEEGRSSDVVLFDLNYEADGDSQKQRFVIRFEPTEQPLLPILTSKMPNSVELEYRIQATVAEYSECPVAPLTGFYPGGDIHPQPFYVMEFIEGRVLPSIGSMKDSFLIHDASPEEREKLVFSGIDAMVEIHKIDWAAAGLDWLNPSGHEEYSVETGLQIYLDLMQELLNGREHPVFYEIWEWLNANVPQSTHFGISWGDARLGNIIINKQYETVAVLDWELSVVGHTELDIGWWLSQTTLASELEGCSVPKGFPAKEEQIRYYESKIRYSIENPLYWELHWAMRSLIILTRLQDRMHKAGLLPEDQNSLMYDNVATRFIERYCKK